MASPRFIMNNPDELAAYIRALQRGLVLFDGRMQVGKTPLARTMAKLVPCAAVDVDDSLDRDKGRFVEALRLEELRRCIQQSFASSPIVVMSGVCAQAVVARLGMTVSARVWVERTSEACLEVDARDFEDDHLRDTSLCPPYPEIEAYIKAHDARRKVDAIYMNAYPE